MPKPKRASPNPGRDGSNGPAPDDILNALALEIIDQDQMALLRDRRKAHRKSAEGKLVDLKHLDRLYKMRDEPASEIEKMFRSMFTHMSAFWDDLTQLDLFVRKSTKEAKAAFGHHGMMAGLKGEDECPPPNLTPEESNEWMQGYDKGATARANASETLAETLAAALATPEGTVIDGTGKGGRSLKAVAVADQAKADFTADQIAEAKATGVITDDDPLGVNAPATLGDQIKEAAGGDGFEASAEELAAQAPRAAVEAAKPGAEDATDPLIVGGEKYKTLAQANAARKKQTAAADKKLSQSEKADLKRKAAGIA